MIKSKFKRVTSLFLATLMCVTTFAGIGSTTAYAASGEKLMNYFEMKWRLSACRIQAGYSQAEVAEILGCSDKTIVSWETGKTAPKMEKAQELSDLYGIPLAYMDFSKAGNSTPLRERESEPQIPAF